jgi:hypothetical protein
MSVGPAAAGVRACARVCAGHANETNATQANKGRFAFMRRIIGRLRPATEGAIEID